MTIIVSVKINDGVVLAADSALSFPNVTPPQIYQHANKIVNLRKGLPIAAMSTGNGGIGSESLETLFKDLRKRLSGDDRNHPDWALDPDSYTLGQVASRVREFLFEEKLGSGIMPAEILIRICGYSSNRALAETGQVLLTGNTCTEPSCVQGESVFGPLWNGELEALDRLILGLGSDFVRTVVDALGMEESRVLEARKVIQPKLYATLVMNAMPIGDAIELSRFLIDTTTGFVKFAMGRGKTVGGVAEIAAITKHEGFKWVQRKHFFKAEFNSSQS
jgi:hypothetical protein